MISDDGDDVSPEFQHQSDKLMSLVIPLAQSASRVGLHLKAWSLATVEDGMDAPVLLARFTAGGLAWSDVVQFPVQEAIQVSDALTDMEMGMTGDELRELGAELGRLLDDSEDQ